MGNMDNNFEIIEESSASLSSDEIDTSSDTDTDTPSNFSPLQQPNETAGNAPVAVSIADYTTYNDLWSWSDWPTDYLRYNEARDIFSRKMERKGILSVSFNQDATCLAVGHDDGYTFYEIRQIDKFDNKIEGKVPERAFIVERLYLSSLIVVVSIKTTRKLQVYHSTKENEICCHTYASAILNVKMNRKRVVVCLENAIHIHNVRDMKLMHIISDTPLNPFGVMDLSNDDSACYLAFPGSSTTGHIHIYDAENLKSVCQLSAHSGPIVVLKFSPDGSKLATASDKGTVIRIFAIPSGERLFEFTRGLKRCVQISSLAFSIDGRYLCSSSNTETVHVFSLQSNEKEELKREDSSSDASVSGWISYFSQQATSYLPTHVNELMQREKSIAIAKLPIVGSQPAVAMPRIDGRDYLLVATVDGYLFIYGLQTDGSGECTLMRQYKIGSNCDESSKDGDVIGKTIAAPFEKHRTNSSLNRKSSADSLSSQFQQQSSSSSKRTPPPVPPAPRRTRNESSASKSAGEGNLFDTEELLLDEGGSGNCGSATRKGSGDLADLLASANLNDLEEFPPLGQSMN